MLSVHSDLEDIAMQDSIRNRPPNADEKARSVDARPDLDDIDALGKYLVEKNRCVLDMLEEYDRRQKKSSDQSDR
jgi:hypothetical protein